MSAAERIVTALPDLPDGAAPVDTDEPTINLPDDFWTARPELDQVRQAAHAAGMAPDAVLGATLGRVAALAPPSILLPAPVGTPGTLDLIVALIARSGAGKSSAGRIAGELVPIDDEGVFVGELGSGEGVIESYFDFVLEEDQEGKKRRVKRQTRRAALFHLDEGQALAELGSRKASTLMPTIRSAWTGDALGQANAAEERRRHLGARRYRFVLLAGFQLEHAAPLLDDVAGGTPQRVVFLAATDPAIPDEAPPWPGPIDWRPPVHQGGPMALDPDVATRIRTRALERSRGLSTTDPLDSHRDLSRLKVAGLLALLDDRLNIDADDWRLSGSVLDASDRVRSAIAAVARFQALEAERSATARLVRRSVELDRSADERALSVMARAIARHVHRDRCEDGCRRRCVSRSTPGKYRDLVTIDEALTEAQERDWITVDGDLIRPGEARPA